MKKVYNMVLILFIGVGIANAQHVLNGFVTSATNEPVTGASVKRVGSNVTTITDGEGKFRIEANKGDVLEFSFVGMVTKRMTVGDESIINVQLVSDAINLEEVVTIGYGQVRKSDLTGSVSSVKPEDLANARVGTVTSALQGLATGVFVTTGSVKPGGDASVIIRGQGSLRAGNAPLYIVDGMPVEGGLQDLSPNDIASIEVLKDASASSIYGSRGSNGVVLVTTKKGSPGKGRLAFSANGGTQRMLNKQDLMNAQQYYELASLAVPDYRWTSEELRLLSRGESTDWQDAVTQNGNYQNYNLSARGGSEKVTHFLSTDWYDQKGTIKNSSFYRATVRYNLDAQTTDWLKSGIRFNVIESKLYNINEEADSGYGTMFSAISSQPTAPIFTESGEYFDGFLNTKANPVGIVDLLDRGTQKSRVVGAVYFEFEPIKDLVIRSENGGELEFFNVNSYEDGRMGQHYPDGGHAVKFAGKKRYLQTENTATYSMESGAHRFQTMLGFSASKTDYENVTADSKNLSPILKYNNLGGAQNHGPNGSYAVSSTLTSFFGRLNYNFDERYLLTATFRGDGSSRFAPGKRWGFFPSLAFAWRISEESFLRDVEAISNLKLRTSAGMLGNQNIGDFAYAATIGEGGEWADYVFGGNLATGAVLHTISNPDLTWEKAQQIDLGLDFGFFNNRLAGTIDTYYKRTRDLLWLVPLPMESGFDNSLTNVGQINNRGIEIGIQSVNFNRRNFNWTTAFNFSFNENEIAELYDGKQDVNKSLFVGKSINEFFLLKADGIWQQDEAAEAARYNAFPGDRKVIDIDDNGVINGDDRHFAGLSVPKFYGSLSNTFTYKEFDFTTFFTYAGGHFINNSLNRYLLAFNPWGNMATEYYEGYWTPNRPSNRYPAPRVGSPYANGDGTDAHLQRGDFIRLRNIELGYNLRSSSFVRRVKADHVRIFASVQNVFTLTEFTGFDVESSDKTNPYPNARSFIAGISLNF